MLFVRAIVACKQVAPHGPFEEGEPKAETDMVELIRNVTANETAQCLSLVAVFEATLGASKKQRTCWFWIQLEDWDRSTQSGNASTGRSSDNSDFAKGKKQALGGLTYRTYQPCFGHNRKGHQFSCEMRFHSLQSHGVTTSSGRWDLLTVALVELFVSEHLRPGRSASLVCWRRQGLTGWWCVRLALQQYSTSIRQWAHVIHGMAMRHGTRY